jgi:outer membrane protein
MAVYYFKEFGMRERSVLPQWVFKAFAILGVSLVFTALVSPVTIAQQPATPASSQEAGAKKTTDADLPPLPASPIEKAEKDGTSLRISLKELTKLALRNNLDIAIQDTSEQLSQQKILAAYGNYDPTLSGTANVNRSKSANTNLATASTTGQGYNQNDRATWNVTFAQNIKTGGNYQVQFQSGRSDNNQAFSLFTPQYNGAITANFTQPLWRDLHIDSTRGNIKLVKLDLQTTDSQFKKLVTDTISNIQSQYWDLVSAIRDYDIKRNSVRLGQITLRDNRKKVEVGTLAPIGITEAQADLASRELNLISSEETILRQENALRQLVSNDRNSEIWRKVIVPTDSADFSEYKVDLDTAINTALKNRPELEQYDIQLRQSDINLEMTQNSRRWQFNLQAQFGTTGTAGPQTFNAATGKPTIPEYLVGGIGTAYKTMFTEGFTNWQVGFQIQVPLRTRNLDSQYAQQQINKRKTLMQRKSQEQSIQVEIRNAVQKLETSKKQVATAEMSVQLNKEQLDGEVKRFDAGLSENFRVLDRQNQLANAEATRLVNLINYKKSVIALQKAMYTLLESNEFDVAKGSSNNVPDLK